MEENNKHVQPNSKEEGVQRLNRILSESLIKATDTYKTLIPQHYYKIFFLST